LPILNNPTDFCTDKQLKYHLLLLLLLLLVHLIHFISSPSAPVGKLIVCYDDNLITIDGNTDLSFTEDVNARYLSYGWHVQTVEDANDIPKLR
jgi:Transketolase, thiamine diphosphate binding domain